MTKVTNRLFRTHMRIVVTVALIGGALVPVGQDAAAQSAANIEFLNPSSFAAVPAPPSPNPSVPRGPDQLIVSDKVPQSPEVGDETYRLSAWVSGVPQSPAVEFELLTRQGVSVQIIDDVDRVGADTFEADWDIPDTLPDGMYTLRATLASGVLGVDSTDQNVMIQRVAERAEITYPDNRSGTGKYGMFVPLASTKDADGNLEPPRPVGNIENLNTGFANGSASYVRAFYTTSTPGSAPVWQPCGTEAAAGNPIPSGAADNGLRCRLANPEELGAVTAVALLANTSQDEYDNQFNQAGDATRVLEPYAQVPTKLEVIEGQSATIESGEGGSFSCLLVTVSLADQLGREIAGANMDAQAWGPHDRLRFGTGFFDTYSADPPDRGSHASEAGIHCFRPEDDRSPRGQQGEHQVIGGPDVKHVEATTTATSPAGNGTSDTGIWGFELHIPNDSDTPERHTTYWEVWVDELNDASAVNNDTYDANEVCRSGLVGWDAPASSDPMGVTPSCPNAPPVDPCATASPQTTQPCPTTSPSPSTSPSPTSSPTSPPQDEGTITLNAGRKRVPAGTRVRFSGAVDSSDECTSGRQIVLQSRRPGKSFRNRVLTASGSDGAWSTSRRLRKTTEWRVLARAAAGCAELTSSVVKVRVKRN